MARQRALALRLQACVVDLRRQAGLLLAGAHRVEAAQADHRLVLAVLAEQ